MTTAITTVPQREKIFSVYQGWVRPAPAGEATEIKRPGHKPSMEVKEERPWNGVGWNETKFRFYFSPNVDLKEGAIEGLELQAEVASKSPAHAHLIEPYVNGLEKVPESWKRTCDGRKLQIFFFTPVFIHRELSYEYDSVWGVSWDEEKQCLMPELRGIHNLFFNCPHVSHAVLIGSES